MHKVEYVLAALAKIEQTVERVIANSEQITSYNYYYLSPSGMERLESTCINRERLRSRIKSFRHR